MAREDFAILTGVWHYAQSAIYRDLESPPNDVEAFADWLVNFAGVPNDDAHLIKVLTPPNWPPADAKWVSAPPTKERWEEAFALLTENEDSSPRKRPDSRLYLYFSGHGYSNFSLAENASLLTANAGYMRNQSVQGTFWTSVVRANAYFGEVVLIMDSCRGVIPTATVDMSSITLLTDFEASAEVKVFRLLAAPYGQLATELPFDDGTGAKKTHGVATYAFLRALAEAPPDAGGLISGSALQDYINSIWPILSDPPLPKPKIDGDLKEIFFAPRAIAGAQPRQYRLTLTVNIAGPAELVVQTGEFVTVATCHLRPGNPDSTIERSGATSPLPFDGHSFAVPLPPGAYALTLTELGGGQAREKTLALHGNANVDF